MCVPLAIGAAIASTVVGAAGAGLAYSQGQDAASSAAAAQQQAAASQNTAFMARNQAAQQQLADQTAISDRTQQTFQQNQQAQQDQQLAAMDQHTNTLAGINTQEQAISASRDQAVNAGLASSNAAALAQAQAAQGASQVALNAGAQGGTAISVSNPTTTGGAAGGGSSSITKDANDAAMARSNAVVSQYGGSLARLSAYNAPTTTANEATTNINTGLMPTVAAEQLLKTSAEPLLAPSNLAYQQAGQYGAAVDLSNAADNQAALAVSQSAADSKDALANLTQSNDAARIQGNLNLTQQRAANLAALGNGLTQLGGAGLTLAGSHGAFKNVG